MGLGLGTIMNPVTDFLGLGQQAPQAQQAATMTPEQTAYMNQMLGLMGGYAPETMKGLFGMASSPQSTYKALPANYFQEAIRAPFLQQREADWKNILGNVAGRSAGMHSSALGKIKGQYDLGTQTSLNQQFMQMLQGERGLEMQGNESALGRQFGAMQAMMNVGGGLLGQKSFENIVSQPKNWLEQLMPALGAAAAGKYLLTPSK